MIFHYVSPSVLPSRSANSVHVVMQCQGLERAGAQVTLYAKRSLSDEAALMPALHDAYGVHMDAGRVVSYFSPSTWGDNLKIAILALARMHRGHWPSAVLSRNLYAAYAIGVLERRPVIFETHQLEQGLRKSMQRAVMTRPWVTTVVVSNKLLDCLEEHYGVRPTRPLVLHDAAPDGILPLPFEARRPALASITPQALRGWQAVCGYFGHLYAGRGIEIIEAMATVRANVLFLVFGGNDRDIRARRKACDLPNLHYLGHVPHPVAQQAMRAVDILLMPYQQSVSIGVSGHDTARWMSPMKMFEYLASGVPIISSDLPVLREVLKDGENCLMADPARPDSWVAMLDRLIADPGLGRSIGNRGHSDYVRHYTWTQRGKKILDAVRE